MVNNASFYKKTDNKITVGSQTRIIYTNKYGTRFIKQNGEYVLVSKKLSGGTASSRSIIKYDRSPNEIQKIKNQLLNMYYDKQKYNFLLIDGFGKRYDYIIYNITKESNPDDVDNIEDQIEIRFSDNINTSIYDTNIIVIRDKDFKDNRITSFDSVRNVFKLDLSVKGVKSVLQQVGGSKYYIITRASSIQK